MAGYLVLGLGFGILLSQSGFGAGWALVMCLTIYAGSCQYVGVSLMAGGASLIMTALTTLMVNARHIFYSLSMLDKYRGAGAKAPYLFFSLTDETYSLLCDGAVPRGEDPHLYRFLVSVFDQCYWVAGGTLGALLGSIIPFDTTGIDFSMTALFVTVFVEQWLSSRQHLPALLGLGMTALSRVIFPADVFLIPAMLGITVGLMACRKRLDVPEIEEAADD